MHPVPMTLQTLALVGFGLCVRPWHATAAATLYWLLVLAGLPVLSGGGSLADTSFLELKTAGYVLGFMPAAYLVSVLGHGRDLARRLVAGLAGHAVVLALGVSVLAYWLGLQAALTHGLWPFLLGAGLKSLVAAVLVGGFRRHLYPVGRGRQE